MVKLTDKDKKIKKGWDFSALSDIDGPGSSHELDSFPLEKEEVLFNSSKKEKNTVVDPLAIIGSDKPEPKKADRKKQVNVERNLPDPNENKKVVSERIVPDPIKNEMNDKVISSFLKKEEPKDVLKSEAKIVIEPEVIKKNDTQSVPGYSDKEVSIAKIIKSKPASEQDEIEESIDNTPIDSAQIAKQRLSYDLKRPYADTDFIHKSTQLVPTLKVQEEIKKKELFSPWYLVPSDEKNKTYMFTLLLMLAVMGFGSSLFF